MASRCGFCCWASSSSRFATPTVALASWSIAARIVAPRCSSAGRRGRVALHLSRLEVRRRSNCLDMPNVPPAQDFKDRVKARAYKVVERNGLIWTYMGKRQSAPPPMYTIEILALPDEDRFTRVHQRECNWFQSLEGDIDTSHFRLPAYRRAEDGGCRSQDDPQMGRRRSRARLQVDRDRMGHDVRGLPSGRARHVLLPASPTSSSRSSPSRPTARSRTRSPAPSTCRWMTRIR